MNRQIAAGVSGFLATAPMTAVMVGLYRTLPSRAQDPLPPRQITETVADEAGVSDKMDEEDMTAATIVSHFAYGAAAALPYAAIASESKLHPAAEGALYGTAVWGASYLGLMPATGLYRSATEDAPSRSALMIAAHLVWGAALGMTFHALTRRGQRARDW